MRRKVKTHIDVITKFNRESLQDDIDNYELPRDVIDDADSFIRACLATKTYPVICANLSRLHRRNSNPNALFLSQALKREVICRWIPHRERLILARAEISKALNDSGVDFVHFRGLSFADRYYKDPINRVSEDIDLLVPKYSLCKTEIILLELGFEYREVEHVRAARRRYVGQVEMINPTHGVVVDINYKLTGNGAIGDVSADMELIWGRARQKSNGCYEMSAEDEFIEILRHFGHGHDLLKGFHSFLLDSNNFLNRVNDLDCDYIGQQLKLVGMAGVLQILRNLYSDAYPDGKHFPSLPAARSNNYCEAFVISRVLFRTQLQRSLAPESKENDRILGLSKWLTKIWMIDTLKRTTFLCYRLIFLSADEKILIKQSEKVSAVSPACIRLLNLAMIVSVVGVGVISKLCMIAIDRLFFFVGFSKRILLSQMNRCGRS